jgi:hypothetical protein
VASHEQVKAVVEIPPQLGETPYENDAFRRWRCIETFNRSYDSWEPIQNYIFNDEETYEEIKESTHGPGIHAEYKLW